MILNLNEKMNQKVNKKYKNKNKNKNSSNSLSLADGCGQKSNFRWTRFFSFSIFLADSFLHLCSFSVSSPPFLSTLFSSPSSRVAVVGVGVSVVAVALIFNVAVVSDVSAVVVVAGVGRIKFNAELSFTNGGHFFLSFVLEMNLLFERNVSSPPPGEDRF